MALIKLALVGLVYCFNKLAEQFGLKTMWISLLSIVLILFGDTLLPIVSHALHVMLETVAYGLEQLFQISFDITPREAEMGVAWIGMTMLTVMVLRLAYKTYIALLITLAHLRLKIQFTKEKMLSDPKWAALMISAFTFSTLGTTFLLFS